MYTDNLGDCAVSRSVYDYQSDDHHTETWLSFTRLCLQPSLLIILPVSSSQYWTSISAVEPCVCFSLRTIKSHMPYHGFRLDEAQPTNVMKHTPLISVQLFVAAHYVSSGMSLLINNCISSVCCVSCTHFTPTCSLLNGFHCLCKTFEQDTELQQQACKHALLTANTELRGGVEII